MYSNPTYQTLYKLLNYFLQHKFIYSGGSDVITDYISNFEFLECDSNHVAASARDTFILNNSHYILRTHTTNFQQKFILKHKNIINNQASINGLNYGTVFRKDDSSKHSYFFHQADGLLFNNKYTVVEYILFLIDAIKYLLEDPYLEFRIRRSYFPFTYPSFEIDIVLNGEFIELAGCGVVHYNILKKCGIKPTDSFAFGIGIERIASIIYGEYNIKKLRLL